MLNVDSDLKRCPESIIEFFFLSVMRFSTTVISLSHNKCSVHCISWGSAEKQVQRWNSMARLLLEERLWGEVGQDRASWEQSGGVARVIPSTCWHNHAADQILTKSTNKGACQTLMGLHHQGVSYKQMNTRKRQQTWKLEKTWPKKMVAKTFLIESDMDKIARKV